QIPLVIFKREKEVARRLEFSGLYITEQPPDDDVKGQWDRLVLNAQPSPTAPCSPGEIWGGLEGNWGGFGVLQTLPDISLLTWCYLGGIWGPGVSPGGVLPPSPHADPSSRITSIDIRYQIWKFGVIFTDNSFLYLTWYMAMSLLGHYNNFFFASHLLDIAMGVKTLRTILSSVTHNGKQV
ncbi:RYR1 protein, partial [Catharus fuscescens]|nr:RYR1 protein [Catharus fuscescens]